MEQLAGEVGPQGQAAVSQKGQHLAVDREAGPPQHEGGHGQPAGHCARSGEEETPEESSNRPVMSRWAHAWSSPRGEQSGRPPARAPMTPERKSIRMTTVKNSTKAQMFRVEDRAPVMEWVKATGKLAAWNWGAACRPGRGPSPGR